MKRDVKKFIALSIFLILIVSVILVSAQSEDGFFARWREQNLNQLDAKLMIWFMVSIIVLAILMALGMNLGLSLLIAVPAGFILTAYVTPDSIIGIFRTYNTLPLALATLLPLGILFSLTYLSVSKASRSFMTFQWVAWAIYFFFNAFKLVVAWLIYIEMPIADFVTESILSLPPQGTEQYVWFFIGLWATTIISGLMTFMNGHFMNWAMKMTIGLKKNATMADLARMKAGMKTLREIGKETEGK